MSEEPRTVVVLGAHDTGKTHFGAQALGRLSAKKGRLQFRAAPSNVALFENALRLLNQGLSAPHTPVTNFGEVLFPVVDVTSGESLDLVWPDYGGEQITNIVVNRSVPRPWAERVAKSDAWILLVRLQSIVDQQDRLARPPGQAAKPVTAPAAPASPSDWSHQASLTELLQMLLYTRGTAHLAPIRRPVIAVALSCWDEYVAASERPPDVFRRRMPLLESFISANWDPRSFSVYGLSSLGHALQPTQPDSDYIDSGPESFGYVVTPTGVQSEDLTLLVADVCARFRR